MEPRNGTSQVLHSSPSAPLNSCCHSPMVRLKNQFTVEIVDTPPVNAVTDAALLASSAHGTIVVAEQGRTTFPDLRRSKQILDRVGAHTIGAVMNNWLIRLRLGQLHRNERRAKGELLRFLRQGESSYSSTHARVIASIVTRRDRPQAPRS